MNQRESAGAEVYVSTDIEADGPIPGPYSMLSIGSAAFSADRTLLATFSVNLEPLAGASSHPDTMAWWALHPDAWAAVRTDPEPPGTAMRRYEHWLQELPGLPVLVGYPAGYDFMFVQWYFMRFLGTSPFRHRALDVRTYAMAVLGKPYSECGRGDLPSRFKPDVAHTHVALDDALEQGEIFCALVEERSLQDRFQTDGSREGGQG